MIELVFSMVRKDCWAWNNVGRGSCSDRGGGHRMNSDFGGF